MPSEKYNIGHPFGNKGIKTKTGGSLRLLAAIMLFAVLLRAPGIPWGLGTHDYFEPDESQHVGIAKNFINIFDDDYIKNSEVTFQPNARGFGTQLALLGYPILKIFNLSPDFLFLFGRLLSLVYSLLLIALVYFISFTLTGERKAALLSSLLLSIFDLHVTYSHYGTPETAHAFWGYLSIFSIFLLYKNIDLDESARDIVRKKNKWSILLAALSIAMALSFRFDAVPLLLLFLTTGSLLFKKKNLSRKSLLILTIIMLLIFGFFYLSVGFRFSLKDLLISRHILISENYEAVARDAHYLYNPILYLSAVISGTSIPVMIAFVFSLVFLFAEEKKAALREFGFLLLLFCFLSFIVLWNGDAPFVRRALIFLPCIAMITGYGFAKFAGSDVLQKRKLYRTGGLALISVLIAYTALLSLVSQHNFFSDNRYRASEYLNGQCLPDSVIAYSPYAKVGSMPRGISLAEYNARVEWVVLHEAYYGRYWKYFTTPFKIPACCNEVYHCNYNDCILIQALLSGNSRYRLVRRFDVKDDVFPERIIFKRFFGTYETFLGDILIYRKTQ